MPGTIVRSSMALALAVAAVAACSITPAQREATERAWAERDQERARECARAGLRFFGGTCLGGGGP